MAGDASTGDGSDNISSSTFAELTDFQRDILIVLSGDTEMKGLSVKEELEKYYENTIHHGRLYPNLDKLVDKHLVDKFELDKRSNGYRLTLTGEQLLENRLAWESAKFASGESRTPDVTRIDPGVGDEEQSSHSERTTESDEEPPSSAKEDSNPLEGSVGDSILNDMRGDFEDDSS